MSSSVHRIRPLLWIVPAALLLWAGFTNAYPWFDTSSSLASAQDLLAGRAIGYAQTGQPAFHPLMFLLTVVAAPLDEGAGYLVTGVTMLAFAALCWAVFRVGSKLFSWQVGVVAAAIVYTSVALQAIAVEAYGDIVFATLVMYAVLLEVERPRCGWPVLVLLGVAGLQRPEAWLLALAYWIYLFPGLGWRTRLGLVALVAAAPAIWLLSEAAVVGGRTSAPAVTAGALRFDLGRAFVDVPAAVPGYVSDLTRKAVLIGGAAGVVCALSFTRARAYPLIALAAVGVVALAVLGATGQPVVARYAIVIAVVVALYCAVGAVGWTQREGVRCRRLWKLIGAGVIALLVVLLPRPIGHWMDAHDDIQANGGAWRDMRAIVTTASARAHFARCKPLYVPSANPVPYLRFALDAPLGSVAAPFPADPRRGLFVVPRRSQGAEGFLRTYAGDSRTYFHLRPAGARLIAANASWILYAGRSCQWS